MYGERALRPRLNPNPPTLLTVTSQPPIRRALLINLQEMS